MLFAIIATNQVFSQDYYYWYKNTKQELILDNHRYYITVKSLSDADNIKKELNAIGIVYDEFKSINIDSTYKDSLNVYWTFIYLPPNIKEYNNPYITYSSPSYTLKNGAQVGISHLLYVKLKTDSDTNILKQLARDRNISVLGRSKYIDRLYTLCCTNSAIADALSIANELHSSQLFDYAVPDIMSNDILDCVSDVYFNSQWGLNNTGQYVGYAGIDINYCLARQITTGNSNIIVAVVDQGVEINHPDLTNMYYLSYDTEHGTSPSVVYDAHGTACAGIIGAAANNEIGIAGIAPDCPIMSISNYLSSAPNSVTNRAEGINYAWKHGAAIINNSWHSTQYPVIEDAIDSAYLFGRNGKGCLSIFSAGNSNSSPVAYPASLQNVLAVGAISPCGKRKSPSSCDTEYLWGSNFGKGLDVMAPGVLIPTTDRVGSMGFNQYNHIHTNDGGHLIDQDFLDQDYTTWFNGTSAAAPHVSGVAALMLSVNPNLTAAQVARIIKGTAQKVRTDLYTYEYKPAHLNGTWHLEMGHGLVDAAAAVSAAATSINDLYIRDNATDNGMEPYYSSDTVNLSPDIKLYTLNDQEVTDPQFGVTYKVKVTIRNNSANTVLFNPSKLNIHWLIKSSTPMWYNSWSTAGTQCGNNLSGNLTAPGFLFSFVSIAANSCTTITRNLTIPDLTSCIAPPIFTNLHLVAELDDGFLTIGKNDNSFPLDQFVKTNNNVAWHQYPLEYDVVLPPLITSISPNPTDGQTTVSYRLGNRSNAAIMVSTATGTHVATIPVSDDEGSVQLDLRTSAKGQYVVQLVASNEVLDAKQFVVE